MTFGSTNKIELLNKRISELETKLETEKLRAAEVIELNDDYKQTVEELTSKSSQLTKEFQARTKTMDEDIEKKVNIKLRQCLAKIGVNEFLAESTFIGANKSDGEHLEKFMSLTGIEQTNYYREHRESISRAQCLSPQPTNNNQ